MKKIHAAVCALASVAILYPSGYQVIDQGSSNMGTAMAGAVTNANNDASAAFWNPSAAVFVEGKGRLEQGVAFIVPSFELKNSSGTHPAAAGGGPINGVDGGNGGNFAWVPSLFGTYKFDEKLWGTLAITAPYGLETEYSDGTNFIGRYHGIRSKLMTIDVNPSLAYKFSDEFSIAGGVSIQYIDAILTSHMAGDTWTEVSGDGYSVGFNLGATYQYAKGGRIGAAFRSQVNHKLHGTMLMPGNKLGRLEEQDISCDLTIPNSFVVGIYQRLGGSFSEFAVMLDYGWTNWKQFDELVIKGEDTTSVTQERWKNTSRLSFGIHYYPSWNENLTFRAGCAWDESPISSPEFRTVRIPDNDRIWASFGVGYTWNNIQFDLAYTYLMFDDSFMNNTSEAMTKGTVTGTYVGHAHIVGITVGLKF